jgi:hypothetical protein
MKILASNDREFEIMWKKVVKKGKDIPVTGRVCP